MGLLAQNQKTTLSLQDILLPVQTEIQECETVMFGLLQSEVDFVRGVAEYILKNGGKRIRPILTVVCAKLAGYTGKAAYKMGACVEFIHTASLLHDDVVDNADLRRGRPSANSKWGNHVSVLVGDFFYCRASQLLTAQGDLKILKIITDCITSTTEGEVLEITKSADINTTVEDYLTIIKNKTALLMASSCQVGGVLGGLSEDLEKALRDYGYHLGMAFQLADDALDYLSHESVFGKTTGIDLQEGKLTLPLITALKQADPQETQLIKNALVSERLDPKTLQKVGDIIRKYKGFEHTYEQAQVFIQKAKKSLSVFRSSIEKDILLSLADFVIERDR